MPFSLIRNIYAKFWSILRLFYLCKFKTCSTTPFIWCLPYVIIFFPALIWFIYVISYTALFIFRPWNFCQISIFINFLLLMSTFYKCQDIHSISGHSLPEMSSLFYKPKLNIETEWLRDLKVHPVPVPAMARDLPPAQAVPSPSAQPGHPVPGPPYSPSQEFLSNN